MKIFDAYKTAENITRIMDDNGVNGVRLAETLGVSSPAVYSWRSGRKTPSIDNIVLFCEIFDVDIKDVIGLEEV